MQRRSVNRRLIGLMLVGLVLVAAYQVGAIHPLADAVAVVAKPFQLTLSRLGDSTAGALGIFRAGNAIEADNQHLQAEVAALREQLSQTAEIKAQNDELRQQLGVGSIRPDRLIAAEVVGYQPDNFRQFITIGRGSQDGIQAGMAVVEQGELVGTVQEVGSTTAKVFLIIDPNFRVAALDQDQSDRPTGTIHGQIGGGLQMDEIAQTETVKPGDTVVTSGLGGAVEQGLIIGHVQAISRQDNGVFQSAQVTTDVQFDRLNFVYVVARPQ